MTATLIYVLILGVLLLIKHYVLPQSKRTADNARKIPEHGVLFTDDSAQQPDEHT